jgi:hypothetical protein
VSQSFSGRDVVAVSKSQKFLLIPLYVTVDTTLSRAEVEVALLRSSVIESDRVSTVCVG